MWLDRMNRPAFDSADGPCFDAWMNADPRHRAAFAELAAIWDGDELTAAFANAAEQTLAHPRTLALPWRRALAAATAVACAAAVALVVVPAWPRHYATAPGERRQVVLADGSTVGLGGNTAIRVQLLPWRRDVALEQGEAGFDIAHDASRPFAVAVDETRVTVLGTAFHVDRLAPDRMVVNVSRGRVRVDSGDTRLALAKDEAAQVRGDVLEKVALLPEQAVGSTWFVARDAPLAHLVEKLRRFSHREISIESGKAASLRVTGRFDVSDVEGTLAVLNQAYDVDVATHTSSILVW